MTSGESRLYHYITPSGMEEKKPPSQPVSAAAIFTGFTQRTSAHGIPHVRKARGRFKTGFWGFIGLVCFGFLIFHTVQVSLYFFQYKYNVVVVLVNKRQLVFPAVTVCNLNPLKASAVSVSPELSALLDQSATSTTDPPTASESPQTNDPAFSKEFLLEEEIIETVSDMNSDEQVALGYTADEFILSCRFSGYLCYPSQFSYIHDVIHGNCYSFNWNETDEYRMTSKTGRRYGLKMILNIQQDEYITSITESAGARVVVHSQEDPPFPADEGILLSPGHITSIGMRQLYIQRLPSPHGDCTDPDKKDVQRNVFEELYPVKYTVNGCIKTCYQRALIKECGCADATLPRYGAAFDYVTVMACKRYNSVQEACRSKVTTEFSNNEIACHCPNPCSETTYDAFISSASWPSEVHEETALDRFEGEIDNLVNDTTDEDKFRRNLLKVEVYYEDLNYKHLVDKPAFRIMNYFSDLGGILGLWVGCSILSIFELVELVMDFIVLGYNRMSAQSDISSQPKKNSGEKKENLTKTSPSPPPAYSVVDHGTKSSSNN